MRACMLAYAFYESDNRIRRYAEALAARGDEVEAIALRREGQSRFEIVDGVRVYRIQRRRRDEKSRFSFLCRLLRFLFVSSFFVAARHLRRPYRLIHVHSVPDFEVFAAWFPKMLGARLILDIHDIVPEFYAGKFHVRPESLTYRMLLLTERLSCAFANHVIIANHLWHERLVARSVRPAKCSVYLNYPDPRLFFARPRTRHDDRYVLIYAGGLQRHQGLDVAVRALALVARRLPNVDLHIVGEGAQAEQIRALAAELGVAERLILKGWAPISDIPPLLANADVGIVPKRADSFGDEAFSTKVFEYMTQGVPVVVSRTRVDSYYFNDSVVRFFESGNPESMADAIVAVATDQALRSRLSENGRACATKNSWATKRQEYYDLVDSMNARSR